MSNYKKLISIVISFVFAVSCLQEKPEGVGDSEQSFLPDEIFVHAPKVSVGADPHAVGVKTMTPDGKKVYWEKGDQIALFPGADEESERYVKVVYTAEVEDDPQPSARFYKSQTEFPYKDGLKYLAAFPASAVDRWGSNEHHTCYVMLPPQQTAVAGGWDPSAGILASSSNTSEFKFEHAVAYVKFVVDGSTSQFVSVDVAYPDLPNVGAFDTPYVKASVSDQLLISYGDNAVSVSCYVKGNSNLLEDYTLYDHPSSKATIVSSDGQAFGQGEYYVAVVPRSYPSGLSLVFKSSDGKVAATKVEGPIDLTPGKVMNVGSVGELTFKTPIRNHTIWTNAEGKQEGVVFWVDEADPTKAKIVSVCNHVASNWAGEAAPFGAEDTHDSSKNYDTIAGRDDFSADKFPAVAYCKSLRETFGGDWLLPSVDEMRLLYNSYYGRLYISPLRGNYSTTDENGNNISYPGYDYRKQNDMTNNEYQRVLSSKKNFDDQLASLGEVSPACLDGVLVSGTSGKYTIDWDSYNETYGTENGVTYWLHYETRSTGTTSGANSFYCRIGSYLYGNGVKTQKRYIRCIKDVALDQ